MAFSVDTENKADIYTNVFKMNLMLVFKAKPTVPMWDWTGVLYEMPCHAMPKRVFSNPVSVI